ncbi:hypothetical protein ACLI4Y_00520 [Natrialbaceae archaeon A-CW3]
MILLDLDRSPAVAASAVTAVVSASTLASVFASTPARALVLERGWPSTLDSWPSTLATVSGVTH